MGSLLGPELPLGHDDPHRASVLQPLQAMDARRVVANTPRRFLGHLDLGDQVALGRIPSRELDAGGPTDDASSSVASDEILRPQRLAVGQLDVHASVVLGETRHDTSVTDLYRELGDPVGHDPLQLVLPDPERIRMTRREVAHVQHRRADHRGLRHLTRREEPISDAALIEHFYGARMNTSGPRADEHVIRTPFDDRDVHLRQCQLGRQHHPRRTASGDHHRMIGHHAASSFPCLWIGPQILRTDQALAASARRAVH